MGRVRHRSSTTPDAVRAVIQRSQASLAIADSAGAAQVFCDVTPVFHPAATRDRPWFSRISAGEATSGVNPARCCSSPAAKAAGVA